MTKLTSVELALLVEVKQAGSLTRAALSLGVTTSAISQQLARLEQKVGVTLVERNSKRTRLTSLGEKLAEYGIRVQGELEAAEESLAKFTGEYVNRLRIGAPSSLSLKLLPDALAATRYRASDVSLSVVEVGSGEGLNLVANNVLDLALSAFYGEFATDERVTLHHLIDDPMVVVLADDHPLAQGTGQTVRLEELVDDDWISGAHGRPLREQLDEAGAAAGMTPRVPFITESFDVAQALADVGVAVALVPLTAVTPRAGMVVRHLEVPLVRRIYAVTQVNTSHIPLVPTFLGDLARIARSIAVPSLEMQQ